MSDNTYTGTSSEVASHYSAIIDPTVLSNILSSVTPNADGTYTVGATDGQSSFTFDASKFDVAIVNDAPATITALLDAATNSSGGYDDIGDLATYVTNTGSTPVTIVAAGPAFVELQGTATVAGGTSSPFVVDASHDSSDVKLEAGTGSSFLMGGSGSDTLTGSTAAGGHAILVAGSGPTTMTGGLGADSLYGGGNTTMTGGSGAGQVLEDFTAGAHDSITAGTGGGESLSVKSGSSTLNDLHGINDTLFAGSGQDTLFGSTNGSSIVLEQGNSSVQSAASDTIYVAPATVSHSDTITASTSGLDQVTFQGYSAATVEGLVTAAESVPGFSGDSVTINFGTTDGVTQTATLNNVSHIHFN